MFTLITTLVTGNFNNGVVIQPKVFIFNYLLLSVAQYLSLANWDKFSYLSLFFSLFDVLVFVISCILIIFIE
jgi:hypothetical protein